MLRQGEWQALQAREDLLEHSLLEKASERGAQARVVRRVLIEKDLCARVAETIHAGAVK